MVTCHLLRDLAARLTSSPSPSHCDADLSAWSLSYGVTSSPCDSDTAQPLDNLLNLGVDISRYSREMLMVDG